MLETNDVSPLMWLSSSFILEESNSSSFEELKVPIWRLSILDGSFFTWDVNSRDFKRLECVLVMPGEGCSIFGCHNTRNNTKNWRPVVKFYRFPKREHEKERRLTWIRFVNRKNEDGSVWAPSTSSRICSVHFFNKKKSQHPLDPSFNPTIYPNKSKTTKYLVSLRSRITRMKKSRPAIAAHDSGSNETSSVQYKEACSQTDKSEDCGQLLMFASSIFGTDISTQVSHDCPREDNPQAVHHSVAKNTRAAKAKDHNWGAKQQAAIIDEEWRRSPKYFHFRREIPGDEEHTRIKSKQAEYQRRRRANLTEEELADRRKQCAEYQRRRRAAIREGRLHQQSIQKSDIVKNEMVDEPVTSTTRKPDRRIVPKVRDSREYADHSLPANGILEPEITLVESSSIGFMNFIVAMPSSTVACQSGSSPSNSESSRSKIGDKSTVIAAVKNSDGNLETMQVIEQTCEDFDDMFEAENA